MLGTATSIVIMELISTTTMSTIPILTTSAFQLQLAQLTLVTYEEFLCAYLDCRKHKRWTNSAIEFELNLEENLLSLYKDLTEGTYKISKATAFVINDPKVREVFAANFRDRVVHHLVMNKTIQYFEEYYSDASYSCRKGRGVLAAVQKLQSIMKQHPDWCVLGLDISAFFPSINRKLLKRDLLKFFQICKLSGDYSYMLFDDIVSNDVSNNCKILGMRSNWNIVPKNKSLFGRCDGIPIGDLTSLFLANFVLTPIDMYLEYNNIPHVRYVDDLRIVGPKQVLRNIRFNIFDYIQQFKIFFNPHKVYFQDVVKGCPFLGYFVTRNYILPGKRIRKNIKKFVRKVNTIIHSNKDLLSVTNAYLGILQKCISFRLKLFIITNIRNTYNVTIHKDMRKISINLTDNEV